MAEPTDVSINPRHLPSAQDEVLSVGQASVSRSVMLAETPSTPVVGGASSWMPSPALFSPTFSNLKDLDVEKLKKPGAARQEYRRKLLRGATVLIVMGGYSGKKFIYERLKELGVKVVVMDQPESIWAAEAEKGTIHAFMELDFHDYSAIFENAMKLVESAGFEFNAVTTYYEDAVPLAARIAVTLGLDTNPVEACDRARNKNTTRAVMQAAGLPTPAHATVRSAEDLEAACKVVGFPAILKPSFGASSLGVCRVENEEEAKVKFEQIMSECTPEVDVVFAQGTELVMEEYYDGDEFDVDMVLSEGEVVYAKVSDNYACWEPWFQETGTCCPSQYPEDKQAEIVQLATDTTLALGFKAGAFHVELKYTSRGPRMIEVNARMGGVSVREMNLQAWGVDLVEEHVMTALKIPARPYVPEKPLRFIAGIGINAPYSGTVTSGATWIDFVEKDPLVTYLEIYQKAGQKVTGPEKGMPDWLAEVRVMSNDGMAECLHYLRDLVEVKLKGRVPVEPTDPKAKRDFFFPSQSHPFC